MISVLEEKGGGERRNGGAKAGSLSTLSFHARSSPLPDPHPPHSLASR